MKLCQLRAVAILIFGLVLLNAPVQAQQQFKAEIDAFKQQDKENPPLEKSIIFVGSSSFRLWKDMQMSFPGYKIVNRGFGGASLSDLIYYADDVIFTYKPKEIVIYCGENDFTQSDEITGQIVADRFIYLYKLIREKLPEVPVIYVSIKPSPSRVQYIPKIKEANRLIRDFLKKEQRTSAFLNVFDPMMKKGKPDETLFGEDMLHMNEKGYALWKKIITPYLMK
ncbi:GDSL-type esterase/lipase family protein [Gynurincola endophyticus]|jgi:lysophospholipase L1-like esterase|uniref:GDSL-type esterase/lipase family protein n=1 Tax=Gynurincola endophyticus TaxID=2479004 RepID=UPI000F8EBC94|nr:GDSL-type esterase/lipase family protein [Gynurincola endophyticus]